MAERQSTAEQNTLSVFLTVSELDLEGKKALVPFETAVSLFVCGFCALPHNSITINLVLDNSVKKKSVIDIDLCSLHFKTDHWIDLSQLPLVVSSCTLPIAVADSGRLVVCGLSSVLRQIIRFAQNNIELTSLDSSLADRDRTQTVKQLLGLRQNCLCACSEVSPWTKFCEVTFPALVERIIEGSESYAAPPLELALLENQLSQLPPSLRSSAKKNGKICSGLEQNGSASEDEISEVSGSEISFSDAACPVSKRTLSKLNRRFVESKFIQLTDLIIYVGVGLMLPKLRKADWVTSALSHVRRWYVMVSSMQSIHSAQKLAGFTDGKLGFDLDFCDRATAPCASQPVHQNSSQCDNSVATGLQSLAIDESSSTTIQTKLPKFKASRTMIASTIDKASDCGIQNIVEPLRNGDSVQLPWETYPRSVDPSAEGGVPGERVARKREQLESMAAAVVDIASLYKHRMQDGKSKCGTIVDFCSGGGHLGILLAYLLPDFQVILVENKEESIRRAVDRIGILGLANITVVQCNLGFFEMKFDIGVCLHACGVSTDLVMEKCLLSRAAFVIAPCCYGAIQNTHSMLYPRSRMFRNAGIDYGDYLVLGHGADQTQISMPCAEQGRACMTYIDTDRCHLAVESGYQVVLCTMSPPTCSPKNHILIGQLN